MMYTYGMKTDYVFDEDLRPRLQQMVAQATSQRAFATAHDIDHTYLSRVLRGERPIGKTLAALLGYTMIPCYAPLSQRGRPRKEP